MKKYEFLSYSDLSLSSTENFRCWILKDNSIASGYKDTSTNWSTPEKSLGEQMQGTSLQLNSAHLSIPVVRTSSTYCDLEN